MEEMNLVIKPRDFITKISSLLGLYKFCTKFNFHRFVRISHEFYLVVNMNNTFIYSIYLIFK
jgi:hypothetical protein